MCRRVGSRRPAAAELTHPAQHALQQFSDRPAAADRAGERILHVLAVSRALVLVEFGELLLRVAPGIVGAVGLRLLCDSRHAPPIGYVRWITPKLAGGSAISPRALGHAQRFGGRIDARCQIQIDQRSNRIRQQFLVRRQRTLTLDGEVTAGQRRPSYQLAHDVRAPGHRPPSATPVPSPTRAVGARSLRRR